MRDRHSREKLQAGIQGSAQQHQQQQIPRQTHLPTAQETELGVKNVEASPGRRHSAVADELWNPSSSSLVGGDHSFTLICWTWTATPVSQQPT